MPVQQAANAHRQLESGTVHQRIIRTRHGRAFACDGGEGEAPS
jgi:hypothetical protein